MVTLIFHRLKGVIVAFKITTINMSLIINHQKYRKLRLNASILNILKKLNILHYEIDKQVYQRYVQLIN